MLFTGVGQEIEWNIGSVDILGLSGCMHAKWAEVTRGKVSRRGGKTCRRFPAGYRWASLW